MQPPSVSRKSKSIVLKIQNETNLKLTISENDKIFLNGRMVLAIKRDDQSIRICEVSKFLYRIDCKFSKWESSSYFKPVWQKVHNIDIFPIPVVPLEVFGFRLPPKTHMEIKNALEYLLVDMPDAVCYINTLSQIISPYADFSSAFTVEEITFRRHRCHVLNFTASDINGDLKNIPYYMTTDCCMVFYHVNKCKEVSCVEVAYEKFSERRLFIHTDEDGCRKMIRRPTLRYQNLMIYQVHENQKIIKKTLNQDPHSFLLQEAYEPFYALPASSMSFDEIEEDGFIESVKKINNLSCSYLMVNKFTHRSYSIKLINQTNQKITADIDGYVRIDEIPTIYIKTACLLVAYNPSNSRNVINFKKYHSGSHSICDWV